MFYILYGKDDFSINQAVSEIKAGLEDRETLATNTTRLEGQRLTLTELRNKCNATPFFSSHRLVIVDGLLGRFEAKLGRARSGKARSGNALGEWEGLASYVQQMPQTTVLVLIDDQIQKDNPLLKQLSPLAEVKTFPLLHGSSLRGWIRKRAQEGGGTITSQAVDLLVELVGGDLWAMNAEMEKLLLYCRGRPIGEDEVRQLTSHVQEANIFALADAVAEGRTESAQGILHRLYDEGVPPTYILTMITRQFRLIARVKDLEPKLSRVKLQDRLGLKQSYLVDKTLSQARLYDLDGVKRAYDMLLETDLAIKTGKYSDKLALELLVTELACLKLAT